MGSRRNSGTTFECSGARGRNRGPGGCPFKRARDRAKGTPPVPLRRRSTMAATARPGLFARKPTEHLARETSGEDGLKRAVGVLDLTALGIGAIIGTGIFVIIGEAIALSGPSIVISFALPPPPPCVLLLVAPPGGGGPFLGALLRRAGVVDPGLGQRVHLRLRHAR